MTLRQADDGTVRTLTLDRPDARNALDLELLRALRAALAGALSGGVRCLVLTGEGTAFCAGADVKAWAEQGPQDDDDPWVAEAHALAVELAGAPIPTVALLNGAAVGAGLDLALACDFRLAADGARFACAYTWLGYPPDVGGTWLLPRLVGLERAKWFVYTGEFWDARTALERGLVSEVVPRDELTRRGAEFAAALAAGPTVAIGHAKRLLDGSHLRDLASQLEEERRAGEACAATEDHREGLAAAGERREPVFRGR